MAPPDDAHASDDLAADALPRHTTPTWEVELLISGVAVFAMLQLPGWLDDRLFTLLPRLGTEWGEPLKILYVYTKSAAVILAATFAVHLLLRAHWIALVGMHSVYPGGVRWERLRMGPVQRRVEQQRSPAVGEDIERADNRATVVFAVGVVLASTLLLITLAVLVLFAAAIGAAAISGIRAEASSLFLGCLLLVVLPMALASLVDRRLGDRLPADGPVARLLAALFRFYGRVGLGRWSGPTRLFASHGGENRTLLVTLLVFGLSCVGVMLGLQALKEPESFGQYAQFPRFADPRHEVASAHYDDQRDPLHDPAVPYLQGMVIAGPYVRLVLPFRPDEDGRALAQACPHLSALQGDARAAAALDCLARLHAIRLDGQPLPGLRYEPSSDPRTNRPALLVMIDVRTLAPGRHALDIARAPADAAGLPYRIAFWR